MKVSGVASMDKSMDGGSAQSRLKTLLPKNYMIDLNSLYRSLTVKKSDKQSAVADEEGYKAHRFTTVNPKKTFRSRSEKEMVVSSNRTWRYSQKKVNNVEEQSNAFLTIPQPQISQKNEDEWSLKCSCILTALKNSRVSFENRSKQKRQLFVRIKSMHKQFDRQKNILMRRCAPKARVIQSLKQQFSSGIACKTIVPLYVSYMAHRRKTRLRSEQVAPEVTVDYKPNLNNSRYRDIPISEFIYEKEGEKIDEELEVKLQKISRYRQKKINKGWVSLGQRDYRG